jgi:hypothetical protein
LGRNITAVEESGLGRESGEEQNSIECEAFEALSAALERIGCHTEMSGQAAAGDEGMELPSVTFRASETLLGEILALISELANRPPSRARLIHVWCVESCPSRQGGVVHTLSPRRGASTARISEVDVQAARRDSETLAAFLLLRSGQMAEQPARAPHRRTARMPVARPTDVRSRGYFRGTHAIVPPVAAGR